MDAFRRIVQSLRQSSRALEKRHGVSAAQLFVLQCLAEAPASSLSELAERTYTHQSSVSVVVSRLAERGLVDRRHSAVDGRRLTLSLTDAGRAVLAEAPEAVQFRMTEALATLAPERLRALSHELGALVSAIGAGDGDAPHMFFEEPNGKGT